MAMLMVRDMAVTAEEARNLATSQLDKLLASMLETPERAANALEWMRGAVQTRDNLKPRDVEALALLAQCDDAILAWADAPESDAGKRAQDTLSGLLAYLARKLPATAFESVGNAGSGKLAKSEVSTAILRSLRAASGRAVTRKVQYIPEDLRAKMLDAQKREADAQKKRDEALKTAQVTAQVSAPAN